MIDIKLDRAIALVDDRQRLVGPGLGVVAGSCVTVSIQPKMVAKAAAQQLPDRKLQRLASEVKERVFDAGDGKDERGSRRAAVTSAAPQGLVKWRDVEWVLPKQTRSHPQDGFLDGEAGGHGCGGIAFAGAADALVGIDTHKGPDAAAAVWLRASDNTCLYIRDFQGVVPFGLFAAGALCR